MIYLIGSKIRLKKSNFLLVGPKTVGLNEKPDEILVILKNLVTLVGLKLFEVFSYFKPRLFIGFIQF